MISNGTIAIIGNGPVPDDAGRAIAAADCVIRFNDCRSFKPGERTDVVAVCNTGRPAKAMLGSDAWTLHPAMLSAKAIGYVRDRATLAALRAPDARIVLAGFSHEGWEGHPFAAERRLVERYECQGRLVRFPGVPLSRNFSDLRR